MQAYAMRHCRFLKAGGYLLPEVRTRPLVFNPLKEWYNVFQVQYNSEHSYTAHLVE